MIMTSLAYSCISYILVGHSSGGTHILESSSMTVPVGHSHPPTTQILGQGLGMNLSLQVV